MRLQRMRLARMRQLSRTKLLRTSQRVVSVKRAPPTRVRQLMQQLKMPPVEMKTVLL